MTKQEFEALVARGPVLLDGAMGSNLLEQGDAQSALSELWADRTGTVLELQAAYAAAGSQQILYAPTFQAQPEALAQAGWTGSVGALNARLVALTPPGCRGGYPGGGDLATMADAWVLEPGEFPPDDRPIPATDWGLLEEARTFWWRRPFCTPRRRRRCSWRRSWRGRPPCPL